MNSKEFKEFLADNNTSIIFTAVNSPFSNALNERLNQTLVNKIRCRINEQNNNKAWTTIAHEYTIKYNKTEHTTTGFAPIYLMQRKNTTILPDELHQETCYNLHKDKQHALEKTIRSHNHNKILFDKNRKNIEFKVGDRV